MGDRSEIVSGGRIAGRARGATTGAQRGAPWFVQFWPLFIAGLMAVSIAASLATVVIAYRHADEDVRSAHGARFDGSTAERRVDGRGADDGEVGGSPR